MIKIQYIPNKKERYITYSEILYSTKFGQGKNALSVKEKFNTLKKEYPFNLIFLNISFENLIFITPNNIKEKIYTIEKRIIQYSQITTEVVDKNKKKKKVFIYNAKEKIKQVFDYKNKFQKVVTPFFTDNFNFRTCFYCNKDFITNFIKDKEKLVSTFQLDHFYDKGTYPYLALSFYNLIPSCPTCNSTKVKGSKDCFKYDESLDTFTEETCIAPNSNDFSFDKKVKFKLFLSNSCKIYISQIKKV